MVFSNIKTWLKSLGVFKDLPTIHQVSHDDPAMSRGLESNKKPTSKLVILTVQLVIRYWMVYVSQRFPLKIHAWSIMMSDFWTVGQDHEKWSHIWTWRNGSTDLWTLKTCNIRMPGTLRWCLTNIHTKALHTVLPSPALINMVGSTTCYPYAQNIPKTSTKTAKTADMSTSSMSFESSADHENLDMPTVPSGWSSCCSAPLQPHHKIPN